MAVVTVEVTQEDIDQGQGSFTRIKFCPVYRAAKRAIPELVYVSAKSLVVRNEWGDWIYIPLPPEVIRFIQTADTDNSVRLGVVGFSKNDPANLALKPFKFFAQIPDREEKNGQNPVAHTSRLA